VTEPFKGATPADWFQFDFVLGLGEHLLPCAQADAQPTPGSAIKAFGKVPSMYNAEGQAFGLKGWQSRPIMSAEIQQWAADPRLNLCVRLGSISGVHALDIDVEDRAKAEEIVRAIEAVTGPLPKRWRENSGKCLLLFRAEM
jgi:hypothetical protein